MKVFTRSDMLSWRPCIGEIETLRRATAAMNERISATAAQIRKLTNEGTCP